MPTNRTAWQDAEGLPVSLRETPYPTNLSPTQVLIKPSAWAVNPADHAFQSAGNPFFNYPLVLGEDIAGTVVAVGNAASSSHRRFAPGDRVFAMTASSRYNFDLSVPTPVFTGNEAARDDTGAFQEYVVVEAGLTCPIPASMSFAEASVLPLGLHTAAQGLFAKAYLALPPPRVQRVPAGKTLLVWGASSSVGSNAIQLAVAAGLEVMATASAKNFEYVKSLGAGSVFDYSSDSVVSDLVAALDKVECAGIFVAAGEVEPSLEIAHRMAKHPFVVTATFIPEGKVPGGVRAKMVFGNTTKENEIGPPVFEQFLPEALEKGVYKAAPEPAIVGTKGLEGIQEALETLRNGVSAKKIVVVAE